MESQEQKSKKKISRRFIITIIAIIVVVLGWAGLTKAGFIPNYLDIEFLCGGNENNNCAMGYYEKTLYIEKPVIYLYPTQEQNVSVKLDYQGKLAVTYPEYNNGWNVKAYPDGKIINQTDQREYSYLFWEGTPFKNINWDLSTGFVVKGSDTVSFLQDKLSQLGLTAKEYNEFIVYWYPRMKDNEFNLIHFSNEQYTSLAPLTINPKPDSMLRVFMVFKPLNQEIAVKPQEIQPFARQGFTVVEWGGTELR